jgi:DNA-binding CsgD family transcriptional regulator
MSQSFYSRILEIGEVDNLPSFRSHLAGIGEEMGFGLYSVLVTRRLSGCASRGVMMHNASAAWDAAANDVATGARDPFLDRMKRSSVPSTYDQALYVGTGCADLWEEQAAYGYKTGIGTGLHLPGGRLALVGFDREEALPHEEARLGRLLADLQLLAVHAYEVAFRLLMPQPESQVALTERQREVLGWIARGKTAWATGQILGVSERTVNGHLAAIYSKLDAGSQTQAVFNAVKMGLL